MPKSQFSDGYRVFVEMLVQARKESGLTQTELAARIGRKQGHISIIENQVRRVDLIEFCALVKAMGHDPVTLFQRIYEALPEKLDI